MKLLHFMIMRISYVLIKLTLKLKKYSFTNNILLFGKKSRIKVFERK